MRPASLSAEQAWMQGSSVLTFPTGWRLDDIVLWKGHLLVVSAGPGVGKTLFSINWVVNQNIPTLYFSADTDELLFIEQVVAILTNTSRLVVREGLQNDPAYREKMTQLVAERVPGLVVDYDPPTMQPLGSRSARADVDASVKALIELWGHPPRLIVFDVAKNVFRPNDSYEAWANLWEAMVACAKRWETVVVVLHHLGQSGAARYAPGELAAAELLLGRAGSGIVVRTIKNRGGRTPNPVNLATDYETATIKGGPDLQALQLLAGLGAS